jgi:hypothetical protein
MTMKYLLLAAALSTAMFVHYMNGVEEKCLELGNAPAECAKL